MRSSRVVTAPCCQCQSRNSPGFDSIILRHSGICGAADEAVLNNVHKKGKIQKNSLFSRHGEVRMYSIALLTVFLARLHNAECWEKTNAIYFGGTER
jgi:hypothetical protein